jgi:hypothetical protein
MAQMTLDIRTMLTANFPKLFNHYVSDEISDATPVYNCIAWAYGTDKERFWPKSTQYGYSWPPGITNEINLEAFKELYASIGYKECRNGEYERGYEKIVVFVNSQSVPTHAARQLTSGTWTSKLGNNVDIDHTIEGMDNGYYGTAKLFMKRATGSKNKPFHVVLVGLNVLINMLKALGRVFYKSRYPFVTSNQSTLHK